jgi:hypothetical protein
MQAPALLDGDGQGGLGLHGVGLGQIRLGLDGTMAGLSSRPGRSEEVAGKRIWPFSALLSTLWSGCSIVNAG